MAKFIAVAYSFIGAAGLAYAWIGDFVYSTLPGEHLLPYIVGYVVALPGVLVAQTLDPTASGLFRGALAQLTCATVAVLLQAGLLWLIARMAGRKTAA